MFNYIHYPTWFPPQQFKDLFTPDFYIDTLQNYKRNVTNKIITDKTLNKAANDYIDAQTAFAKTLTKNTLDLAQYSVDSIAAKIFPKTDTAEKPKAKSL